MTWSSRPSSDWSGGVSGGAPSVVCAQCNHSSPSTHFLSQLWDKVPWCLPTMTQRWLLMWCCMFPLSCKSFTPMGGTSRTVRAA